MDLSNLRKEYKLKSLRKQDLQTDPILQFEIWFKEAQNAEIYEANAMAIATAGKDGAPSSRMVLLKHFSEEGFFFFTNGSSRKATQMKENPAASALFFWKELERQIHIEGPVHQASLEMSSNYFKRRPRNSQLAAWASKQDAPLDSRSQLEEKFIYYAELFKDKEIPAPDSWVGFCLKPIRMEFWQGRESRLHDRFLYLKKSDSWTLERISP